MIVIYLFKLFGTKPLHVILKSILKLHELNEDDYAINKIVSFFKPYFDFKKSKNNQTEITYR